MTIKLYIIWLVHINEAFIIVKKSLKFNVLSYEKKKKKTCHRGSHVIVMD